MLRARGVIACALGASIAGCPSPQAPSKPAPTPLETSDLASITRGPGARWAIGLRPKRLFAGPLGGALAKVLSAHGIERLSKNLGVDVREIPDALFVGLPATSFFALHLPADASPANALDAFEARLVGKRTRLSPRADVVHVTGELPGGAAAATAGMWSTEGDTIVGESGRLGAITVSIALATGTLPIARSLGKQAPFAALAAWAADAPIALYARCPLDELLEGTPHDDAPVIAKECEGVAMTGRAAKDGKLAIALHLAGRWGSDAPSAEAELRAAIARVVESDLGHALSLRDATIEVTRSSEAVDAKVEVDATKLADALHTLVEAGIGEVLR